MAAAVSVPYDWLRQIPHSLLEKDEIPILSTPGPFPWEKLSLFLAKTFQLEKLDIQPGIWESRSKNDLLKGLGGPLRLLNIELSPVLGTVTWVMPEKDIPILMSLVLSKEARANNIIEKDYLDGFFDFVALETILSFNRCEYDKGLIPHISDSDKPLSESALCLDITINCNGTSFIGRLLLGEEFRHSLKERYAQRKMSIEMQPELAKKLQVIVCLEAGRTSLSKNEWASVHPGDYVILDTLSFDPKANQGRVLMTMNNQTIFRARLKQGNLKILEFPLYHEVETAMSDEDDDDDTEEYFDESEFEDDSEFEHDDDELETKEHTVENTPQKAAPPSPPPKKETVDVPAKEPKFALDDVPLTIVVEVGRLQISIQKLMELQPGNLLELDIHPENGVDLVVNGKCIARGELLSVGDSLGVRILDKG